jgi:hypothetical protein
MKEKHAILMIFDYQRTTSKSGTPCGLLGMRKDVERSYFIASSQCGVPDKNITVITDVVSRSRPFSWEEKESGLKVIEMDFPSIDCIVETIAKTMISIHNNDNDNEVEMFIYYSGHGMEFVNPDKNYRNERIASFILVDRTGRERRYLTRRSLAGLLYGRYPSDEMGLIQIPVISRTKNQSMSRTKYSYNDETILVAIGNELYEPKKEIKSLFLIDACHSGSLSGLKYRYVPKEDDFDEFHYDEMSVPPSVGVSATNEKQEAPSCGSGSPFTSQVCNLLNNREEDEEALLINSLSKRIRETMHPLLRKRCTPTISSSKPVSDLVIPTIL